jgi:hypothetical protein
MFAASRASDRSGATCERPSRTSPPRDPPRPTRCPGEEHEVAIDGVEVVGGDVGETPGGAPSPDEASSEVETAFTA